jgi:hypothetical protein
MNSGIPVKKYLYIQVILSNQNEANYKLTKYENTMLFDIINKLENKLKESEDLLKKFSSENLKSMFCIHSDIPNKPGLIVDDLSASTSHASDSELDSILI